MVSSEEAASRKTAGDYALLHANGMSWEDLIQLIRAESCSWPTGLSCRAEEAVGE